MNDEETSMTTDMTNARYWAISGMGYGRGFNPGEAQENYVATMLRDYRATDTVFKTKPKWEAALRTGEAKATHFHAPEGVTGFILEGGVRWTKKVDGKTVVIEVSEGERLDDRE